MTIQNIQKLKSSRGFTIIELFLVVAIVAILAGATAPFYSRFVLQNETANTGDALTSTLRKAQSYAMAGKNDSNWSVNITGNQIQLIQDTGSVVFDKYTLNSNLQISGFSSTTFTKTTGVPNQVLTVGIAGAGSTRSVTMNNQGVVSN